MNSRVLAPSCPCCARLALRPFRNEILHIEHAGLRASVPGLSGWRCPTCREVVLDHPSARRYQSAGEGLVRFGHRERQRDAAA